MGPRPPVRCPPPTSGRGRRPWGTPPCAADWGSSSPPPDRGSHHVPASRAPAGQLGPTPWRGHAGGRPGARRARLSRRQEAHLVSLVHSGEYSTLGVAELFGVGRSTVHRAIQWRRAAARAGLADASTQRQSHLASVPQPRLPRDAGEQHSLESEQGPRSPESGSSYVTPSMDRPRPTACVRTFARQPTSAPGRRGEGVEWDWHHPPLDAERQLKLAGWCSQLSARGTCRPGR